MDTKDSCRNDDVSGQDRQDQTIGPSPRIGKNLMGVGSRGTRFVAKYQVISEAEYFLYTTAPTEGCTQSPEHALVGLVGPLGASVGLIGGWAFKRGSC